MTRECDGRMWNLTYRLGIVTLANDRREKSCTQSRSRRGSDLAPRLHGRGSECPVRLCGTVTLIENFAGQMAHGHAMVHAASVA